MQKDIKQDLTHGSVPKQLVKYAAPLVVTSLLQALYSIVDMLIAGQFLGESAISAINNASQITSIITNACIGLSLGGNILVSQYFGSKDEENRRKTTGTFFTAFFFLGIIVAAAVVLLSGNIVAWMKAPALDEAAAYLRAAGFGVFFIFCYNAMSAVIRALGNSKKPMHFILAATVVNVALDIVFMGFTDMGTAGAALATVISQGVSCALAFVFILKNQTVFAFSRKNLAPDREKLRKIFKVGFPCCIQWTLAGISFLVVTFLINGYHDVVLSAANGISNKIRDLSLTFINTMSAAAAAMIAQNLGAKMYDRAKSTMFTALKMTVALAVFLVVVIELIAPYACGIFLAATAADKAAVVAEAAKNLRIEVPGQIFYAVFFIYHSLMTGAGHTKMVLFSSTVNCIIFRAPLAILLNLLWPVYGIYLACAIAPASSIPIGMWYYRSNRWRTTLAEK